MNVSRIRLISYIIMAYMLLALMWWTYLLYNKNEDVYRYQIGYIEAAGVDQDRSDIVSKYMRQRYMIIGEGIVLALSLITGLWLINRAAQREIADAEMKNNFLLSVTHELKSPLASIKLVLETLLNKDKLTSDQRKRVSQNALHDTHRLESMVNKLLLTAKIEQDYNYNFEPVQLKYFLSYIIHHYPLNEEIKNISLECPPELSVEIDQESMQSVVYNLIENALKYSKDDDSIRFIVTDEGKKFSLSCIDNGPGISAQEKAKVTNKFYRIGNEEFRKTEGSGLGLFIVSTIVHAHHGKLKIKDNHPSGAIFTITLPQQQNVVSA